MAVIGNLLELAGSLEAGIVPADMFNVKFVHELYRTEQIVFGEGAELVAQLLVCAALTGTTLGLGLDNPQANSERVKKAGDIFAAWIRRVSPLAQADPYVASPAADAYLALEGPLRENHELRASLQEEGTITTVALMLGSENQLKRHAFGKETPDRTAAVDWAVMVRPRGLGPFLASVINAMYHKVGAAALSHLLAAFFGARYAGTPQTLRTSQGGRGCYYGGVVAFPVYGKSTMATFALKRLLGAVAVLSQADEAVRAALGQPRVFTVDRVPEKLCEGEHLYTVDMGDSFVSDAQIAKTVAAAQAAADHAAADHDEGKKAKIVGVYLHLETASGQMSKVHFVARGEIGHKARASIMFDGKGFSMYETVPEPKPVTVHCYVHELGTDQTTKDKVRDLLCKRVGVSPTSVTAGDHRSRNRAVVEGGIVLFADTVFETGLMRVVQEVSGVDKWLGGSLQLSALETRELRVVGDSVTVIVAFSPTALRHLLDKLCVPYAELRVPGAGGSAGAGSAELSALRQQVMLVSQKAEEKASKQAEAFSAFAAERAREAQQAKEDATRQQAAIEAGQQQVRGLQDDLRRVYGELKCSQESAALAAELNAKRLQAQTEKMMQQMQAVQQQSVQASALMHAIFKAAPDLALAVRDNATITLSGQSSSDGEASPGGEGPMDMEVLADQLVPPAGPAGGASARELDEAADRQVLVALAEEELQAANAELARAQRSNSNLAANGRN